MIRTIRLNLYSIFALVLLLSCIQHDKKTSDAPTIKAGEVTITGQISGPDADRKDSVYVSVLIPNPVSGEEVRYKALTDQSGKFKIEVFVETDVSLIGLYTSLNPSRFLYVKLKSGVSTDINIAYKADLDFEGVDITPKMMTLNDMTKSGEVLMKMVDPPSRRKPEPLYNKPPDYFLSYAKTILTERLEILTNDELLSKEFKQIIAKDFSLNLYNTFVFDYDTYMILNYKNTNTDEDKEPEIQKIDKSYYRFLKDFNLNDPQYLLCFDFPRLQRAILENQILGLPKIGDSDISSWLTKVKGVLSDLVGFDEGPYYDNLAANAYGKQLSEELKPLSEKQKANIAQHWQKGEIAKILLRKNEQIVELDKFKSPAIINDISSVSNDKVMETIVGKYKNKVVFVDLWATWCRPCLDAMKEFRDKKSAFHDKDVVFVYITNESSPRKLWQEKIVGIGNEHYYLTGDQWEYVMSQFELNYIPSYLLFNKKGDFKKKYTGFPGNDEVIKSINGWL